MLTTARSRFAAASLALCAVIGCSAALSGPAAAVGPTSFQPDTMTCASSTRCVALGSLYYDDGVGVSSRPVLELTFSPASPSRLAPVEIGDRMYFYALDCAGPSLCVAAGGTSSKTPLALAFNPASPGATKHIPLPMDKGRAGPISCASTSQCTVWLSNFDDPTHTQSEVVTFNPTTGAVATPIPAPPSTAYTPFIPTALDCPSASQCSAVGPAVVTFDPQTGAGINDMKRPASRQDNDSGAPNTEYAAYPAYSAVDCPTTQQCTATGKYGTSSNEPLTAIAVTFNPVSGQAIGSQPAVLGNSDESGSTALSCPTTSECATEVTGSSATFATVQTATGALSTPVKIDGKRPVGLFCASSASSCTTVLNGIGAGEDHSSAPPEFDTFAPATGTVAKTAPFATTVGGSPGAVSGATRLKAALAKCKKIKNHKKHAACVKRAKKRYG